MELPKLNSVHSSNRQTPLVAGRPSSPNGQNGYSGPAVTTGIEIGKTANLYSESLRTMDLAEPTGTVDMSNSFAPQSSWRSSEMASRPGMSESRRTNPVETQMTDYTEYTTDGSYTDSEEGESGSETDSGSEDDDVESRPRQRTARRQEVLPAGNAEGRRQ